VTIPSTGRALRESARTGLWSKPTAGVAPGYAQANLVVLPRDCAFEFFLFCQRNPKPCPILDATDAGDPEPLRVAPGADLRCDLPLYRVYRSGQSFTETTEIFNLWQPDSVGFLLGCSFTFDHALAAAGIIPRHVEEGRNVPMYRTNIPTTPAGRFRGPLVVSMRPMTPSQAEVATRLSAAFPRSHGGPVHVGNPATIGIVSLEHPDYGEAVSVRPGEIPVFWACGVTPQAAIAEAGIDMVITHAPGHMFVTDLIDTGN
jgi:uncharacterized protein YcsI (UPF0317 family)